MKNNNPLFYGLKIMQCSQRYWQMEKLNQRIKNRRIETGVLNIINESADFFNGFFYFVFTDFYIKIYGNSFYKMTMPLGYK